MRTSIFQAYLSQFEDQVIVQGVKLKVFGSTQMVTMRPGKLANTKFGETVGTSFNEQLALAVDYYGHIKRSFGLLDLRKELSKQGQVRRVECTLVHFASLRIDDIANVCNDPHMIGLFPEFKKHMIDLRGFRKA